MGGEGTEGRSGWFTILGATNRLSGAVGTKNTINECVLYAPVQFVGARKQVHGRKGLYLAECVPANCVNLPSGEHDPLAPPEYNHL